MWQVGFVSEVAVAEVEALPNDLRKRFLRLRHQIETQGLDSLREPNAKHLEGKLWELRMSGRDGIARSLYVAQSGKTGCRAANLREKDPEIAEARDRDGSQQAVGEVNEGGFIPAGPIIARWMENPEFAALVNADDHEFDLTLALGEARGEANPSQAEIARRMGTSQPAVARLEGGRGNPSLATLRRYAEATGTKLRISFERKAEAG